MKLDFQVQTFLIVPHEKTDLLKEPIAQYMFHIPIITEPYRNYHNVSVETTITFPDGYSALYQWNDYKEQWEKKSGEGKKVLKYPLPTIWGKI